MLCLRKALLALIGFHSLYERAIVIWMMEIKPSDEIDQRLGLKSSDTVEALSPHQVIRFYPRQVNTPSPTLTVTVTVTALLTQAGMNTETIVLTQVVTETVSPRVHRTTRTSETRTRSSFSRSTIATRTTPVTSSTSLPQSTGSTTPVIVSPSSVPPIPIGESTSPVATPIPITTSAELPISTLGTNSINSINPIINPTSLPENSPNLSNQDKIAIPAIVIAVIVALGFIIALLSYLYPHIRESKKRGRSGAAYDEYSNSARKFEPQAPSTSTIDYSTMSASIPKVNKGKSKMIENLEPPRSHILPPILPSPTSRPTSDGKIWVNQNPPVGLGLAK